MKFVSLITQQHNPALGWRSSGGQDPRAKSIEEDNLGTVNVVFSMYDILDE